MKTFVLSIAVAASALVFAKTAFAGDQYIDRTGFAVSGYDVVAYFDLDANPVGKTQPSAVPGNAAITAEYNEATFAFSSEKNRAKFLRNPASYVPQYDGHCAYGVAVGNKVPANPNLWRVVDDKLYLNISTDVSKTWERNIGGYIKKSENQWTNLERWGASWSRIPSFRSSAPKK